VVQTALSLFDTSIIVGRHRQIEQKCHRGLNFTISCIHTVVKRHYR